MPTYASKRPAYKKGYSKRPSRKVTPYLVAKIAKTVARKAQPAREIRFNLQGLSMNTTAVGNSFVVLELTNIAQGPQDNQRLGDQIFMTGMKFQWSAQHNGVTPRSLRLMVVKNLNRNGDLLDVTTWTDLFTNPDETDRTADGLAGDITAPINANYRKFLDKSVIIDPQKTMVSSGQVYVPLNTKVIYDNLGTASTPSSGRIYLLAHVAQFDVTGTASSTIFNSFARVFYRDA